MRVLLALLGAAWLAAPAAAQIDYHNLDHARPLSVEDAYPPERYAFDLSMAYLGSGLGSGRSRHLVVSELGYGFANGAFASVSLPLAAGARGTGSGGLAGASASLLVNLASERPDRPGLGVRLAGSFPVGSAGGRGAGAALRALATRSFGRERLHLNASVALARPDLPGLREPAPRWWAGAALDHTMLRSSTLLIAELTVASFDSGGPLQLGGGLGVRRQVTPGLVIDGGAAFELERGQRGHGSVTLGFSHAFGVAALLPRGSR